MMKKDFLSMPLILGISVMSLVVATVLGEDLPPECNKCLPAEPKKAPVVYAEAYSEAKYEAFSQDDCPVNGVTLDKTIPNINRAFGIPRRRLVGITQYQWEPFDVVSCFSAYKTAMVNASLPVKLLVQMDSRSKDMSLIMGPPLAMLVHSCSGERSRSPLLLCPPNH